MNWQTKELFDEAIREISDGGIFSDDQIASLTNMIELIREAVEKESECSKTMQQTDYLQRK